MIRIRSIGFDMYAIGCTHFGHKAIINLAQRPFSSIEEHDEVLMENWNKTIRKNDQVIFVGDLSHKKSKLGLDGLNALRARLNGRITWVKGNHDPEGWGPDRHTFTIHRQKFVVDHYPMESWEGMHSGAVHLHAHTHTKEFVTGVRRVSVGADATNFRPVHFDEILAAVA